METPRSPKEYLRARRPGRFSDSVLREETELDRTLLEHHLSSLTTRNQAEGFERFAKRLCEAEVCPNLLPQTGPVGGGDSKADSQTYPVADALAATWYAGVARGAEGPESARERWAFAFSAKEKWRPKVQSDVEKIVGTGRGYTTVYFVTSRPVRDKERAEVEDALSEKHSVAVHILDQTWILDKVFGHRREAIAIEELGITGLSRATPIVGPRDAQRRAELEAAERRIEETARGAGFTPATVDDLILTAEIARELDQPRAEIEGRFARARRAARKVGTHRQQVETAYQWAWTLYFYLEDFTSFVEAYSDVEALAIGSRNARDLEQLGNLWSCLYGAAGGGLIDEASAELTTRTQSLLEDLGRLAAEEDRPSTALQARAFELNIRMMQRVHLGEPVDDLLDAVADVVREAEPLLGFPVEPIVQIYAEWSPIFDGSPSYDRLFELLIEVDARRKGEVHAATRLLDRAQQQLVAQRFTSALVSSSRALSRLTKEESRMEFSKALFISGFALDALGLPWAARAHLLGAASAAADEKWRDGTVTPALASCLSRLKWVELRLGRIPQLLAWHHADLEARDHLVQRGGDPEDLRTLHQEFDHLTALLFSRLTSDGLEAVRSLPDTLFDLDLQIARIVLLFCLGHTEPMAELAQTEGLTAEQLAERLVQQRYADWSQDWPTEVNLYAGLGPVSLTSRVLGCVVRIESDPAASCIATSEGILGVIEGFLATTLDRAISAEPLVTIRVYVDNASRALSDDDAPFDVNILDWDGCFHFDLRCPAFDPSNLPLAHQRSLRKAVFDVAIRVLSHFVIFQDFKTDLETLFHDERVYERAIGMTGSFGAIVNVLGPAPLDTLGYWLHPHATVYDLGREQPWVPPPAPVRLAPEDEAPTPPGDIGHQEVATVSLIRGRLWERAQWRFTHYLFSHSRGDPPGIALVFEDNDAGREIFRLWREELGSVDVHDRLRVSIVRGVDRAEPHTYRFNIGTDPTAIRPVQEGGPARVLLPGRIHTESVLTSDALELFIRTYEQHGAYFIVPAARGAGGRIELGGDLAIEKQKLTVRNAWEIGPKDLDSGAIREDDVPVIPEGVDSPPVAELLRARQAS